MEDVSTYLDSAIAAHLEAIEAVRDAEPQITEAVAAIASCIRDGGTVLFCGNGGSAADAQHLAAELVGRFARERNAWPAQALHANTSVLTAVGNDYGFDRVFARQVEAFGRPHDVLVALSTSGSSPNVVEAISVARDRGMTVVGLTGGTGGVVGEMSSVHINIPFDSTARVQEAHILIGHVICGLVEESLCEKP